MERAVTGQPFQEGMVLSIKQSINSKNIIVDIVKKEDYFMNEGTPYQTRWIYEEFSDGSKSLTLSPEDWDELEMLYPD